MTPAMRRVYDVFDGLFPETERPDDTPYRFEGAVAQDLATSVQRLRELRGEGLIAPRRCGPGWIYGPREARDAAILVALGRLGATLDELIAVFDVHGERTPCAALPVTARCAALVDRLGAPGRRARREPQNLRGFNGTMAHMLTPRVSVAGSCFPAKS